MADITNNIIAMIDTTSYDSLKKLYQDLLSIKKDRFEDNERIIIIYNSDNQKNLIDELLIFIDIPEYFIIFQKTDNARDIDFTFSESFCVYPWLALQIDTLGDVAPCCIFKGKILDENKNSYSIHHSNIKEIYFSPYMENLREQLNQGGKPIECDRCWNDEAVGNPSMRQRAYHKFKEIFYNVDYVNGNLDNLQIFDLSLGNSCNLSCRICTEKYSSKIAEENLLANRLSHSDYLALKKSVGWSKDDEFWEKLLPVVDNIKYLDIYGGEPFMSKSHFKFLKKLVDLGVAKNIKIDYNSNGTIYSDEFFKLWDHFKEIKISFSIDDIGSRFEYQRNGADWAKVQENIEKFNSQQSKKFITDVAITVSIQNVLYLPELLKWVKSQSFAGSHMEILHGPWYLSIVSLTNEAKELVLSKLSTYKLNPFINSIMQTINQSTALDSAEDFINFMKTLDGERKQSFLITHPEIAKAMGYD